MINGDATPGTITDRQGFEKAKGSLSGCFGAYAFVASSYVFFDVFVHPRPIIGSTDHGNSLADTRVATQFVIVTGLEDT